MNYAKDYGILHAQSIKLYGGQLNEGQVAVIAKLVRSCGFAPRLLDYGSGKGYQYLRDRIHEAWGGSLPVCYDPGVQPLARRPVGKFQGVICTDVMEHIEEFDIDRVLADIFSFLDPGGFAYFSICTRASSRLLPDGRGVHRTVKPPKFWHDRLARYDATFTVASSFNG